jgi:hypothetical protein
MKPSPEALARNQALCNQIEKRWVELEAAFVPDVSSLPDRCKTLFLWMAIECAMYLDEDYLKAAREARKHIKEFTDSAVSLTEQLAATLRQIEEIQEEFSVSAGLPRLWDLLEKAADLYPVWRYAADKEFRSFLHIAKTQSRPGPRFEDLLSEFKGSVTDDIYTDIEYIIVGRQASKADLIRAMLSTLEDIQGHELPRGFHLTDKAVADLVTVLHDLTEPISSDNVKVVRNRNKDR